MTGLEISVTSTIDTVRIAAAFVLAFIVMEILTNYNHDDPDGFA